MTGSPPPAASGEGALEHAPCGFLRFDDGGVVLQANATLHDMLGYAAGEIGGREIGAFLSDGSRLFYQAHFFPGLRLHGRAEEIHLSLRGKNGEPVPVLVSAVRHERDGVAVNDCILMRMKQRTHYEEALLTASRESERVAGELRESEHFLQRITEVTPGVIHVFDLEEQRCVFINRSVASVLGYSPEEIAGMGAVVVETLMHPDDQSRLPAHMQRVRTLADDEVAEFEHRLRDRGGAWHWFHSRDAVFSRDAAGAVREYIGTAIEITARKEAEAALRESHAEIARASRAKDDFLAALSHELRTPLSPVLMTAAALESDPALPQEIREQLGMMRRNIQLEARLIDDLLDLTRISRGKLSIAPVAADIHQLIRHTEEIVRSDAPGRQVRIAFTLGAARHHALADPARIQQVFWNLIKNALKFTPDGGSIDVGTRDDGGGRIVVSVADTGIGIGADALPHVFNAFEQGDIAGQHRYGGLGLGLAISQAIVEAHRGTIQAASGGPGCGATFTVSLATVDAPATPGREAIATPAPARALRLLIVEDHEATRTVLTRLLTRGGHQVTTAGTIAEALAAFAAAHYDAVISDLGLPDGSGLDLMREIQRMRPVPAIALSGYGMEEDLRQTKEAGFSAHLVKPVNLDQLKQLLDGLEVR